MNSRLKNGSEKGIALVITLVMLSIVTVMAIIFLGVSRRERASVKVAEDIVTANYMADAAVERAKAEAISRMVAEGSKLHYDLFNSRTYNNNNGFNTSQGPATQADPQNVSYQDKNGNVLSGAPYLRMLANMQYDPRVPVFVETNANGATEFRYYLDFDRNQLVETNGIVPVFNNEGTKTGDFADLVGDPEWIGVLERPDLPHSETNRFIGRLAYLVLPAGKTLDANFIHNHVNGADNVTTTPSGFTRNQGVGSWEINLAAFFRDLNTNAWRAPTYTFRPGTAPSGAAFENAGSFLAFRYNRFRRYLDTPVQAFFRDQERQGDTRNFFDRDGIDEYGDGPLPFLNQPMFSATALARQAEDDDRLKSNWPGSFTTNAFTDLQQFFSLSADLTNRLIQPLRSRSTYDRYQFYRMAAQLGVDSVPSVKGKLHLNFANSEGKITNTAVTWADPLLSDPLRTRGAEYTNNTAWRFFTRTADLMLRASIDRVVRITNANQALFWGRQLGTYYMIGDTLVSTNFSVTNIQVYAPFHTNYPNVHQNEYTPAVHRILQVAANIYDNMTNRFGGGAGKPPLPTVFGPIFRKTATNLYIAGWREITSAAQVGIPVNKDLVGVFTNTTFRVGAEITNNFYGQHLVIGTKKGHPNFNEVALQSSTEIARKLEVVKGSAGGNPIRTNQMFLFSLDQRWGMEAWNSYSNRYDRPVSIVADVYSTIGVKDGTNQLAVPLALWTRQARSLDQNPSLNNVASMAGFPTVNTTNFVVVLNTNFTLLRDIAYTKAKRFTGTNIAEFVDVRNEDIPNFVISTTNHVRYIVSDRATGRILDYVSCDNLVTRMDLSSELHPKATSSTSQFGTNNVNEDMFWDPTPIVPGSRITRGLTNQLAAAAGEIDVPTSLWKAFRHSTPILKDDDKNGAISVWRRFMGLPLSATNKPGAPLTDLARQIPFVPSRKIEQLVSWQANDPLVHYMAQDLGPRTDGPKKTPLVARDQPVFSDWNIGALNIRYQPWAGSPKQDPSKDPVAFSVGVKDPGVRRSDDWEFPIGMVNNTNHFFASIGELGQIHRGTPWQTIYLKSIYSIQNSPNGPVAEPLAGLDPTMWRNWAGSAGTHPMHDWKLLDVFTAAPNENATRGLLSVNQTNRAAWSAVLSGVIIPTNIVKESEARLFGRDEGADPAVAFNATYIEPATPHIQTIVNSIDFARHKQLDIVPNPNIGANPSHPWEFVVKRNPITGRTNSVFERLGEILSAPHLTVQSPFLNTSANQMRSVMTDRALEYIPERILSLLQRDEPRFVVYAFGQSLKPAPRSFTADVNYFHMCTNYQVTGETTTKTIFRVEGDLPIPNDPATANKTLRAVVESFEVVPPVE